MLGSCKRSVMDSSDARLCFLLHNLFVICFPRTTRVTSWETHQIKIDLSLSCSHLECERWFLSTTRTSTRAFHSIDARKESFSRWMPFRKFHGLIRNTPDIDHVLKGRNIISCSSLCKRYFPWVLRQHENSQCTQLSFLEFADTYIEFFHLEMYNKVSSHTDNRSSEPEYLSLETLERSSSSESLILCSQLWLKRERTSMLRTRERDREIDVLYLLIHGWFLFQWQGTPTQVSKLSKVI